MCYMLHDILYVLYAMFYVLCATCYMLYTKNTEHSKKPGNTGKRPKTMLCSADPKPLVADHGSAEWHFILPCRGLDHLQDIVVGGPKVGKPWPAGDWRAPTLPMYCLPLGTMFKRMVLPVIK